MKLFLDCEFNEFKGDLISMALVAEDGREWYEVVPDTVGQYVGCIYGEELYEGDIVRSDLGFKISAGVVKQKEDCYAWYVFHKEGSCRLTYAIDNSILDEAFILGNIHDNPELLEDLR